MRIRPGAIPLTSLRSGLVIGLLTIVVATGCDDISEDLNHAAAFGWRRFADTDLDLAAVTGGDFAVAARFMLQYPTAYTGPLLAAADGGFELSKQSESPTLRLRVGSVTGAYTSAPISAGAWHHVAVVRSGGQYFLFLDGSPVCPDGPSGCTLAVTGTQGTGALRLGRPGASPISGTSESQYYGFIDDVAVFDASLSQAQVAALATADRLNGSEPHLFAGWTFDDLTPTGDPLPAVLERSVTWRRGTRDASTVSSIPFTAIVSQARDDATDAKLLPTPGPHAELRLPFPPGEAWRVGQGWGNTNISHSGRADFAWDFYLAGEPVSATNGKPFYAAAGGEVIEIHDGAPCDSWPANYVMVEHAPDEIGAYLHAVSGSLEVTDNDLVATGDHLADVGDTGNTNCGNYHLHFSLHNLPESEAGTLVTIPAAFSDYEVSTDDGASWSPVVLGVPQEGEWVRNP
ncbi:MAG: peptidoglycan DD-metalloendopeptidase family protein [Gemmatimonadetes bacterium]|nr:peptidoglycan DD-metalloendopeptidase family protein [Gemmatimonadota bacterium]NIQ56266.1 peptidoglycan DD-metalloendopeptidase family protein [Gemmatimonadota bacterium]NIU76454.1 peptidoglycan DD-metalloendopeptidase family protein [Gammaproteobacteria bacterium]NIX45938.1 peptidoglycan DD-metalloendopeptidase family protein [Gemmatimonadota bacterium]NIY10259.1 peptidoglycan DD-metalloendopeptidase family protein [Gemmatimonadota bacterium]